MSGKIRSCICRRMGNGPSDSCRPAMTALEAPGNLDEWLSFGHGSIPIFIPFLGDEYLINIHQSQPQLFWCELQILQGYYWFWHTPIWCHLMSVSAALLEPAWGRFWSWELGIIAGPLGLDDCAKRFASDGTGWRWSMVIWVTAFALARCGLSSGWVRWNTWPIAREVRRMHGGFDSWPKKSSRECF